MLRRSSVKWSPLYWAAAYLLLSLSPLLVLNLSTEKYSGQGPAWDFAMAIGFAVFALMLLMFVLISRFRRLTAPFGIDLIYYFHRQIAVGLLLLLMAHVGILLYPEPLLSRYLLPSAPAHMFLGVIALLSLLLLVGLSLLRRRLRLRYETWRRSHLLLAVIAVVSSTVHIFGVNYYSDSIVMKGLAAVALLVWVVLILRVRLFKPMMLMRRRWRVVSAQPEKGNAVTINVEPRHPEPFRFLPGQFAWLTVDQSPFAMAEHPFSIASSAERSGSVSFTIKALGDFTQRLQTIETGTTVYVDGPYGVFSIDRVEADGLMFIAGGIGIVPIMSMLRTLADRDDPRPVKLLYAVRDINNVTYLEELQQLDRRPNLALVLVPDSAPENWQGPSGYIDRSVLQPLLPKAPDRWHYFLCGPPAMMRANEAALHRLGVGYARIHTELFNLV